MATLPARTQKFLDALKAAGWTLHPGSFPGNYRAESPAMDTIHPTPDYIRYRLDGQGNPVPGTQGPYPFSTYRRLRILSFNLYEGRVTFIQARTGVPWVGAQDQTLSMPKALTFISADPDA